MRIGSIKHWTRHFQIVRHEAKEIPMT